MFWRVKRGFRVEPVGNYLPCWKASSPAIRAVYRGVHRMHEGCTSFPSVGIR